MTSFLKRFFFTFLTIAALFRFFPVSAVAGNWLEKLVANLQLFAQKQDALKIHIHTDREVYAANDTVWYKVYVTEASTLQPLQSADIVNVTLWSEANKLISRQKLQLKNGLVTGQLVLPDSLTAGRYTLLSYTNWMRNVGQEYFFRKTLIVIPASQPQKPTAALNELADVTFFPEGGDLVQGLTTRVGVKALDGNGKGIAVAGNIIDEAGKTVAVFKSLYAGIGSFMFTPLPGKKYTARVSVADKTDPFLLPQIKPGGIVLSVQNQTDSLITVHILATPDRYKEEITLIAQARNSIRFSGKVTVINAAGNRIQIPKKLLPGGITQLTVFNSQGQPEAERLVFTENRRPLILRLIPEKSTYNRREQITLHIQTTDNSGQPVPAEISLSATDVAQTVGQSPDVSLVSNLLLTSDLAGTVENPQYYFSNPSAQTREALDNLMLTQGWRRFTWQQVSATEAYKPAFMPESKFFLDAAVYENDKPLGNAFIYFFDSATGQTRVARSEENGHFQIDMTLNTNQQQFAYQVWQNGVFIKKAVITVIPEISLTPVKLLPQPYPDSMAFRKNLLRSRIQKTYSLQQTQPELKLAASLSWLTVAPDKKYLLENYETIKDFEEALKEFVPDVRILTATAEPEPRMISKDQRDFFRQQPMYILDGQPTWNNDFMLRLDAALIREIQIFNSAKSLRQFGFTGNYGVLVVNTKAGNFSAPELQPNNRVVTESFVKARQFYVPKFSDPQTPDFRPTLYWNPTIKTDTNGKATITFPASDAAGIKIYAEGITDTGLIGSGTIELNLATNP